MKRAGRILFLFSTMCVLLAGCDTASPSGTPGALPSVSDGSLYFQAKEAVLTGNPQLVKNAYIEGFTDDVDLCVFTATVSKSGFYDLNFRASSIGGYKENYVLLNGENIGAVVTDSEAVADCIFPRVYMEQGENKIGLLKYWGWIRLEELIVSRAEPLDPAIYDVSAKLCNPDADAGAKRLMSYLADSYGKTVLAGQYCDGGLYGGECSAIYAETGKYPAVIGLDLMDYTPSRVQNGTKPNAVERALEAWEQGAIVTFCWHWNAPEPYLTGTWWRGFYTEETNIDLAAIMKGDDPEGHDLLVRDIDTIAEQLTVLRDAGVPVLWRPLHEAGGGWFWWGAAGSEAYISLWNLLYERLTVTHELTNLIWVWNGQSDGWYPGDGTVDMIGEDIYPGERVTTPQTAKFLEAASYANGNKIIALSESGFLPEPALMQRDGAIWSFIAPWSGEFMAVDGTLTDRYIERETLRLFYTHETIVTLDELPDLKTYPIREE